MTAQAGLTQANYPNRKTPPRLSNNELVDEWDRPCGSGADLAEEGQFTHQFAIADVNHLATFRRRIG
jgi:hypothetical protein